MQRYSRIAIFLHWTIAFAIAFQISIGWALEDLGQRGFAVFQLHKSLGITILALTLIRIIVRFFKPRPAPAEGGWEGALARIVHFGLYAFMLLAPLTGWALVSTAKVEIPTLIFGSIPLPHLPLAHGSHPIFENAHAVLAWLGIALLLLHVIGAFRHHVMLRDGLVWRMVPSRSVALMTILLLLVPIGFVLGKMILPARAPAAPANAAADNGLAGDEADGDAMDANAAAAPADSEKATQNAAAAAGAATQAGVPLDNATAAAAPAVAAAAPVGPPPSWTVRPGGKLRFALGNGGDMINGGFSRWTARIVMDPDHPETATITVDIDLSSASVGDPTQDAMLPDAEFFGVAAHPTATFRATSADKTGPDRYRAKGTLTLKGKTAPQTIRFTLSGTGLKRTVTGSASITRKTFDVGNGSSSGDLAPTVAVDFSFDATGKAR